MSFFMLVQGTTDMLSTMILDIFQFSSLYSEVVMGGAEGAAAPPIIWQNQGKRGKKGQNRMFCPPQ